MSNPDVDKPYIEPDPNEVELVSELREWPFPYTGGRKMPGGEELTRSWIPALERQIKRERLRREEGRK
jgi:hypothetical protein